MELKSKKIFSLRAFLTGCLFAFGIATICPYTIMMIQGYGLSADFMAAGAILGLFILALFLNPILSLIHKNLVFSPSELLLIYMMMLVASAIPTWGLMTNLIPIISGVTYYATPENRWVELILPHIKPWLIPQDKQAITYFYEGLPKGMPIPYSTWIIPLLSWFFFLIVIYFVSICIMVILRKQWVENERLIFPLTVLPIEMVKKESSSSRVPPLFKNKLLWLGFAIPFVILSINGLHHYFHFVPQISLMQSLPIFRRTGSILFFVSFPVLGFAYLLNLNIALSLWLFHLLGRIQTGWFNITGYSISGHNEVFCGSSPMVSFQGMGAMITLVLFGLYMGRRHLGDVFRKAFKNDKKIDDSEEILSYKVAVFGLIIGFLLMFFWLRLQGLPFFASCIFLFAAFVILIGLTRIIAQGGIGFARSQNIAPVFTAYSLGEGAIGPTGYTALGLHGSWASDIRTTVMTSTANSLKINEQSKVRPKMLFLAIILSCTIAYFASAWMILRTGYLHGAINAEMRWFFQSLTPSTGNFITDKLLHPPGKTIILPRMLFTGIGAFVMGLLMFAQYRFLWWPLHYLGLPIADTYIIGHAWFSIFLAWLIKGMVLRYGGPKLYKKLLPLFLGLILGSIVCPGIWLLIDFLTRTTGNIMPIGIG